MAIRLKEVVTIALWIFLAAMAWFSFFGCKAYMQDDGEFKVTFGTTLSFQSVGPKDVDRVSEVGLDFQDWAKQPLVDWIVKNEQSPGDDVVAELNGE